MDLGALMRRKRATLSTAVVLGTILTCLLLVARTFCLVGPYIPKKGG